MRRSTQKFIKNKIMNGVFENELILKNGKTVRLPTAALLKLRLFCPDETYPSFLEYSVRTVTNIRKGESVGYVAGYYQKPAIILDDPYVWHVGKHRDIQATGLAKHLNAARRKRDINVQGVYCTIQTANGKHYETIQFFATRDIRPNEELLVNYGDDYKFFDWKPRQKRKRVELPPAPEGFKYEIKLVEI